MLSGCLVGQIDHVETRPLCLTVTFIEVSTAGPKTFAKGGGGEGEGGGRNEEVEFEIDELIGKEAGCGWEDWMNNLWFALLPIMCYPSAGRLVI